MTNIRIIPRLDIKPPNLIKSMQFEGLRIVGDPEQFANLYYNEGADEIIFMDIVASLYGRNHLIDLISSTSKRIFVPLTVGGGIRTLHDAKKIFRAGADKIALNTGAINRPELITEIAEIFGSQSVVVSIEAKKKSDGSWEAYINNGRDKTGYDAVKWAARSVDLGAGEILVTSIDQEGTRRGFDVPLCQSITDSVSVLLYLSGGMGKFEDLKEGVVTGKASGIAIADMLHYKRTTFPKLKITLFHNQSMCEMNYE